MKNFRITIVISFIFLIALSSCTSRKKILYLQNESQDSAHVYIAQNIYHLISTGDVLYIDIFSLNKAVSETFSKTEGTYQYSMWNSQSNIYINGYSVNDSGYVNLPIIGAVLVKNLKIETCQDTIQKIARQYISDAVVTVKLLSFRYSIIGEVLHPGTYNNFNDRLTIFQAVADAGDVTVFGNKTQAKIIRKTETGNKIIIFDFTQSKILESEAYYIQPNDIIYIEPVRNKSFRQNLPNIALIFSSISTTILVLNFIGK
ncbi:MAG: polysaccharide biosynthesis/export family protein [Bacteroidales bacterium]|nr:polysaccharide biosynthesis/export family protein [Bacteroidales bacterium]